MMGGRAWYLVRRLAGSDRHALDWLERLGIEHYYPMMRELRPLPKRLLSRRQRESGITLRRPCPVPLFPGYFFVRLDLARDDWRRVGSLAGIGGLVCEGNLPVEIAPKMIDGLREREKDGLVPGKLPAADVFRAGEAVRVCAGLLAGWSARVAEDSDYALEDVDAETRVKVLVEMFGRPVAVEMRLGEVEKL